MQSSAKTLMFAERLRKAGAMMIVVLPSGLETAEIERAIGQVLVDCDPPDAGKHFARD